MESSKNMIREQNAYQQQVGHKIQHFYDQPVPIYKLKNKGISFKARLPPNEQNSQLKAPKIQEGSQPELYFFARGNIVGQFYSMEHPVALDNVMFIGSFKGALQKSERVGDQQIYFEGSISNFLILINRREIKDENIDQKRRQVINQLEQTQTSFKGFFKGNFYEWSKIDSLRGIPLVMEKWVAIEQNLSHGEIKTNCNTQLWRKMSPLKHVEQEHSDRKNSKKEPRKDEKEDKTPWEYFLPTAVRFQLEQIRSINLEKSGATISGFFFIEIYYNDEIKELIETTKKNLREKQEKAKQAMKSAKSIEESNQIKQKIDSYHNFLKVQLGFHRDYNITLDFEDDDDEANESQGSEWSIIDKTWDITLEDDQVNQVFKWRVWKCFNAEIDNSFGAFFAPFNLSSLRIVMTLHHLVLQNKYEKKVKVNLIGVDVMDYDIERGYDPFLPLDKLEQHKQPSKQSYNPQHNRFHKINRFNCRDNNVYKIADNRMTLYPYYRSVLINKNTANDTYEWSMGLHEKNTLLNEPEVRSVSEGYKYYQDVMRSRTNDSYMKIETFQMHKWNYVITEVPIYKYVVIDMLQVFVPLILLAAFSLLIFQIDNGISIDNGGYTNLAFRIVNAASLMIAYVSLIPIIRQSLPPMPGITLVEILAYILTVPIFLALISSMLAYTQSIVTWRDTYLAFTDAVFIIAMVISVGSFIIMIILFIGYMLKDYKISQGVPKPADKRYKYRSPQYMRFMEQAMLKRNQCQIEKVNIKEKNI